MKLASPPRAFPTRASALRCSRLLRQERCTSSDAHEDHGAAHEHADDQAHRAGRRSPRAHGARAALRRVQLAPSVLVRERVARFPRCGRRTRSPLRALRRVFQLDAARRARHLGIGGDRRHRLVRIRRGRQHVAACGVAGGRWCRRDRGRRCGRDRRGLRWRQRRRGPRPLAPQIRRAGQSRGASPPTRPRVCESSWAPTRGPGPTGALSAKKAKRPRPWRACEIRRLLQRVGVFVGDARGLAAARFIGGAWPAQLDRLGRSHACNRPRARVGREFIALEQGGRVDELGAVSWPGSRARVCRSGLGDLVRVERVRLHRRARHGWCQLFRSGVGGGTRTETPLYLRRAATGWRPNARCARWGDRSMPEGVT